MIRRVPYLKSGLFLVLLAAFFLVRGIAIQGLYPPLEGPDEYQHIAVIQYLVENRSVPVYGRARVPVSLYPDIVANPHPRHSVEQTAHIGALSYERFYTGRPRAGDGTINLYQAQHPPLYYICMAPLYAWSRATLGFRPTVYLLRLVNIAAAALGLACLLYPLLRIPRDGSLGRLFCLAAAASPMFMVYVSRVANDAFAILFAGMGMVLVLRACGAQRAGMTAGLAGVCTGLAVVSKLNGLVAVPVAVGYWMFLALLSAITWRAAIRCAVWFLAGYLVIALPFHLWAWTHYGTLLPQQETIRNIADGNSVLACIREIRPQHLWTFFVKRIISHTLWTSGWSFLGLPYPPAFAYRVLVLCAACGGLFWLLRRRRSRASLPFRDWPILFFCVALASVTFCAAYLHGLHSLVAYGLVATPSYYVMIGYPAFLACLFAASLGYGRKISAALAFLMLALFMLSELYGLLCVAAPYWAQTGEWSQMLARLDSVHPGFPSSVHFFIFYAAALALLLVALRSCFAVSENRP